jgi:peroxiredoxin Q/BCP
MSYLIEADGTIASGLAAGVQAILILGGEIGSVADATSTEVLDAAGAPGSATPTTPGVVRSALTIGTAAPVFRLPRLDGGELSLLEYRGQPLVVVFTDPECPPCDDLAPSLERAHRDRPRPAMVLISRGSVDANRAMVAKFGLSLPIALQRHWEISRVYGIFSAPSAYYVDEWGVIAEDVAVGTEAVMELVDRVAASVD